MNKNAKNVAVVERERERERETEREILRQYYDSRGEDGFAYDAELAKALSGSGYSVSSIYISVAEHGKSHVHFLGDSLKMLLALVRISNEK